MQGFSVLCDVCHWFLQKLRFALDVLMLPLNLKLLVYLHRNMTLLASWYFEEEIPRRNKLFMILFLSQIICNTYIVPMLDRYTIPLLPVFYRLNVELVFHVRYFLFPLVPCMLRWSQMFWIFAHMPITLGLFLMFLINL